MTLVLVLVLLAFLMLCEVPIAFAMAISGSVGILLINGADLASNDVASIPFTATSHYTLTVIPTFVVMGLLISHSGMLDGMFDVAQRLVRRLPGGLAIATVAACTVFGGISGSSVADAATLGRVAIAEMAKRGYDKAYAAAVVASSATVAILIPPSIVLVIYGILTEESIGMLLLAGIIPGLLTAVVYTSTILFLARNRPDRGGRVTARQTVEGGAGPAAVTPAVAPAVPAPAAGGVQTYYGIAGGLVLFLVVIGGIYTGLFTATEAGAAGAVVALLLALGYLMMTRRGEGWRGVGVPMGGAFKEAGALTSSIFALVIGAAIFTHFLVIAGATEAAAAWVISLDLPPHLIVIVFLVILLILGMFVDGLSLLLVATPIIYPVISELGFSGIWFGVLMVKMIEIGLLTPPVGINVYVVSGLFRDLRVETVSRRIVPFVVAELVTVGILFVFPEIVTFLPDMAMVE